MKNKDHWLLSTMTLLTLLRCTCAMAADPKALPADPVALPSQWSLSGDFTLRYTVTKTDIRPLATRLAFQKAIYPILVKSRFQEAHEGREPSPGEVIPPDVQKLVDEDMKRQLDLSTRPMTLTLAQRANQFLYFLMSRQPDPETAWESDGTFSQLVLADGQRSTSHTFDKNGNFIVTRDLNGRDMAYMPIFCSQTSAFPMIKSLTQIQGQNYQGEVLDPGNTAGPNIDYFYDRTALVRVIYDNNKPKIAQISRRDFDGTISSHMDVTDWLLFKGIWIPSKAHATLTQFIASGKRIRSFVVEWTLIDSQETADPHQFDLSTYVHTNPHIK